MSEQDRSDALFRRLAAEEPPLYEVDDTQPSATAPTAPFSPARSRQQFVGGTMLLLSLIFTIGAVLLFFTTNNSDDTDPVGPSPFVENTVTPESTLTLITPSPTLDFIEPTAVAVLPTAAFDEAAVVLLTPVMPFVDRLAVQRMNQPFTRSTGSSDNDAPTTLANYVVQQGDTLESIKNKFQLEDICSIVWSNERRKVSPLVVGATLIIPPVDGYYARIREPITIGELAERSGVTAESIINSIYNPLLVGATADSLLPEGVGVMIPNGNGGSCNIWAAKPGQVAPADPTNILGFIRYYGLLGCDASIGQGSFPVNVPYSGSFWQGFSAYHTGIDISGNTGDPIVAAGGGTVIFAGWNEYGYGWTVAIAHGSTFTIYAHLNSLSVSCGQQVGARQVIGTLGSSGNSTGPHLHFEIRNANFEPVDPCYTISC
ncbi:MAG: hypothetical protein CUN55_04815 [Phototrophicales bacterium]|nr:MAG: hypothetical protein CUN55_04815 [Phototrophicales bacterium]